MPGYDRTGPLGAGPRTGRGFGMCGRTWERTVAGSSDTVRGIGRGGLPWGGARGRCFGLGGWWNRFFRPDISTASTREAETLRSELSVLKEEIAALKLRLEERDNSS
ncbi:MAG: DUF5320 domain-containing protein [Desulfomonile sp.]|nr:DUF5320 domain-containing protein [Desulfomonile sp.]